MPLLLLLSSLFNAQAQMVDPTTGMRMFGLPTHDFVFPTGFRVVVAPDDSLPAVGVTMMFDGGSAYEPSGRTGMAHMIEHLWFRSAVGDNPPVMDQLDSLGCQWNAWTYFDLVSYSTACPSQVLPRLLQIEANRIGAPLAGITDNELDSERAIVQQEGRVRGHIDVTNPMTAVLQRMHPPDHPYGHLTIGSREDLDRVSLDDIHAFTDARYRAEHATLVIAGDVTPAQAMRLVFRTFDPTVFHPDLKPEHLKRRPLPGIEDPDPDNRDHWFVWPDDPATPGVPLISPAPVDRSVGDWAPLGDWQPPEEPVHVDVEKPTVAVAWMLPPFDPYATGFDESQLGWAANALAYTSIQHLGLKGFGCSALRLRRGTLMLCTAEIEEAEAMDKFASALSKMNLRGTAVREETEQRAWRVARMRLSNLLSLEMVASPAGGRSEQIASHVHEGHSADYLRDSDLMLSATKLDPAYEWLREHLKPDQARVVRMLPVDEEADEEADADSAPARAATAVRLAEAARPKEADPFASAYPNARISERTLPTGLRIVAIDHGRMPFVDAVLYVPAGTADGPPGVDELGALHQQAKDTVGDIRFVRTLLGGSGTRWSAFGIQSTTEHFEDAVKDLREALESLTYTGDSHLDTLKRVRKRRTEEGKRVHAWFRADIAEAAHLPTWPASLTALPDPLFDELAARPGSDLRTHLQAKWRPKDAVLIIVGSADVRLLARAAELEFAKWRPTASKPLTWTDAREWPPKHGLILLDDPEADNADVRLTCVSRHKTDRADVPTGLLGELISKDAFRTLRMEHGLTYSPGAWGEAGRNASQFSVVANVAPAKVPEAVALLQAVLDRAIAADYPDELIEDARLREVVSAPLSRQSRRQIRGTLGPMLLDGWSVEDWRSPRATVDGIDRDALRAVIANCKDELVVRIDGPAEVYAEAIATQLGLEAERFVVWDKEEEKRKEREEERKKRQAP
jgi:predicted Zn-dependent peptidase